MIDVCRYNLASLYWSYTALQIPAGLLCAKYGSSFLLGIAIFGSSVLTLFTPLIVRANVSAFIVLRVLEGAFLGLVASSGIDLISKWSPIYERSIFVTVSYAGLLWGTVFANSISGLLAGSSYGWPSVFYFFGAQGVLWYLCWLYLGAEQPADHPTISRSEIQKIGKHWTTKLKFREIPWRHMLTSIRVWAIILPVFMDCWCFYTFMFSFPSYLSDVHKLDITTIGFTSSIPYVVAGLLTPAWGFFIDMLRKRKYLSTTNARKLSYLFGAGIGGVFIFAMVYASNASTAIVIATIAITVSNFSSSGPGANLVELAPKYSSVLMGISNFACNITGFISPEVVGSLTEHGNIQQWAIVFYITAAIEVFGMLLYLVFGSSEKQPWADN
ncbi:vesicular glutamate transporter 1-like [Xenia sp. Carnegie-2017]|uniref:vesicular glutamate transporter 1-like n=1 Tax=Xenia sp. Carnegie-2017 TaxID=2897299 RepID=UPI001F049E5B|nr:vesicular glutamate transporter 1-like [Xenia sp. Carnegie-2017]